MLPIMVLAYHLILSAYGFWLPNDQRGSWSGFVRAYELYRAGGPATKVATRRSVAHRPMDPAHRCRMTQALVRRPVRFTDSQIDAIGHGFADYCQRTGCRVHGCAVLADHVHLVVARHRVVIERVCDQLKGSATAEFNRRGLHPFANESYRNGRLPTPWARKGWWVLLNTPCDIMRTVRYVEENPVKAGLGRQCWDFVTAYGT